MLVRYILGDATIEKAMVVAGKIFRTQSDMIATSRLFDKGSFYRGSLILVKARSLG
jgi:hypothetical protein